MKKIEIFIMKERKRTNIYLYHHTYTHTHTYDHKLLSNDSIDLFV